MNEITDMSPSTAVATREPASLASLTETEHSIAVQKASLLSKSDVIPAAYRGKPANCLVAIEYANRLGCSFLAVMQNLDIIEGRPALRATFLIGTVNASQRFTPIRFRWEGKPGQDDWGCRAVATDRESGEECVGPLITIALAKAEGWYQKRGSKWQTIPELMLTYRAGAWWTRIYCPELALGLHTSEEIEDAAIPPDPRAHASRVAAALASADPEPEVTGPDYETVDDVGSNGLNGGVTADRLAEYRGKYFALLAERGMDAEEDRHAFQKRLRTSALVADESAAKWNVLDFQSAIHELGLIEVGSPA
jgi:hypothetical protein